MKPERTGHDATPYGHGAAAIYDLIVYGRSDAEADPEEVGFLDWAFSQKCRRPVRDVLDVGCGTGPHLIPLARRGYRMTGFDSSEAMLARCREKLKRRGLGAELRRVGLEQIEAEEAFDAALCMGSVICYLLEDGRIDAALRRLLRALRPGGLLVIENDDFLGDRWSEAREGGWDTCSDGDLSVRWRTLHGYEEARGVYHIRDEAQVRQGDRRYEVKTEECLRVIPPDEMAEFLGEAGFTGVSVHRGFDHAEPHDEPGDVLIFLALRPSD